MSNKPNVIMIFPDQLRRSALGCYGDPNIATPHIDRLAAEGTMFNQACAVHPVCVPARFSVVTGQYPHTRMIPNIGWRMSPSEHTIAHDMNEAGYETCYVGKWHLYGAAAKGSEALRQIVGTTRIPKNFRGGFERWRGFDLRNEHFDTFYFVDDDPQPVRIDGYQTDGLFDAAIKFMRSERDQSRPYFLVLSVEAPHFPFDAPEEYRLRWEDREISTPPNFNLAEAEKYALKGSKSKHFWDEYRTYYAMIENLDDNVGRLEACLQETGCKDDTAIVLYSDHGELMGSHGLMEKRYPYEESVGVPLIVSYPGKVKEGARVDLPTSTIDILPTLRGLAGLPEDARYPGIDLLPYMQAADKAADSPQRPGILLEGTIPVSGKELAWRAVRTDTWLYSVLGDDFGGEPWQLFCLSDDPFEMSNLINDQAYESTTRELHSLLKRLMVESEDHYPLKAAFGYSKMNLGAHP